LYYKMAKKILDLLGGSVGIVIFAIVYLPFAIAIKLDSPGPVIVRLRRVGKNGKQFRQLKFRSMIKGAEEALEKDRKLLRRYIKNGFKLEDDERITRVGLWLRKLSLDEIPQFLNVLRGDMSLVGPRPRLLLEWDHFVNSAEADQIRNDVLTFLPGITGYCQVHGRAHLSFREKINQDYLYTQEASFGIDLWVILQTFLVIFNTNGAW